MLAGGDGLHHQCPSDAVAANQLDDDVDVRVRDHRPRVTHDLRRVADDGLGARRVEVGHHRDANAAPGAALDLLLIALQHVERAGADGADAQQADLNCVHVFSQSEWRFR